MIIDHMGMGVRDIATAREFFVKALKPLGIAIVMEVPNGIGMGRDGMPAFWLSEVSEARGQLHVAFAAENREQVRQFYTAAIDAGATDNGPPGIREHYHPDYYAAFVLGPDGHNIEAVCHRPPSEAE